METYSLSSADHSRNALPKFLIKTYEMVDDESNNEYVGWNEDGNVVMIRKLHEFSEQVLPKYFKHNNYASFVRQLNMYGFSRAKEEQQAFSHPLFLKGAPENLALIKRKSSISKPKAKTNPENTSRELQSLLAEVASLQAKQEEFDKQVIDLKAENEHLNLTLWETMREASKRQKLVETKLAMLLRFLAYLAKKEGDALPNVAKKFLPQIMESANDSNLQIDFENPQHPEAIFSSTPKVEDNNLVRMKKMNSFSSPSSLVKQEKLDNTLTRMDTLQEMPSLMLKDSEPNSSSTADLLFRGPSLEYQPTADSLVRHQSLQSFISSMESGKPPGDPKYNDLARDLNQYINDQDNTFKRLHSLSSTISDPFAFQEDIEYLNNGLNKDKSPQLLENGESFAVDETATSPGTSRPSKKKQKVI